MSEVVGDARVLINELDQFVIVTREEWLRLGVPPPIQVVSELTPEPAPVLKAHVAALEAAGYVAIKRETLQELWRAHKILQALRTAQASKSNR